MAIPINETFIELILRILVSIPKALPHRLFTKRRLQLLGLADNTQVLLPRQLPQICHTNLYVTAARALESRVLG